MSIFDLFAKLSRASAPAGPVTAVICGLGNPGAEYAHTRHNVGFDTVDLLAERLGVRIDRLKWRALTADASLAGQRVLLMKPQTFMNDSGAALREAAAFYRVPPERVIVFCDDTALPCGRIRIRARGSDGGHNGLKSIIAELGSEDFLRIRLGVGAPPGGSGGLISWVLGRPVPADAELIARARAEAVDAPAFLLEKGVDAACSRFNGFDAAKPQG